MDMNGSQTEQNLMKAFAGESQARNRYTFYAEVAADEGYVQIAKLFRETADNERAHAYGFFKLLDGGMPEFTASYPAGPPRTTAENLRDAADGELLEWGTLYPDFADVAEEEGFKKAAAVFRKTTEAEKYHERRYRKLLANVEASARCSARAARLCGSARNAGMSTRATKRLRCARCAASRRPTSRCTARTTRTLSRIVRRTPGPGADRPLRAPPHRGVGGQARSMVALAPLRWAVSCGHVCYPDKTTVRIHRRGPRGACRRDSGPGVDAGRLEFDRRWTGHRGGRRGDGAADLAADADGGAGLESRMVPSTR